MVDGDFGPETKNMVEWFQGWSIAVAVDGIVGFQTWAKGIAAAGQELASVVGV